MGATLTPADAQQEEDEEDSQADHDHEEPVCGEMRISPEPGGLGGGRDTGTEWQGRGGVGEAICKACLGSCSLAGFPEAGAHERRDARASPEVRNSPWAHDGKAESEAARIEQVRK